MVAEFEVRRAVVLEDRSLFVLSGVVAQGNPRTGMHAALVDGDDRFDVRVHGVEYVDAPDGDDEGGGPALTFSYSRNEKLERWRAIDWPGKRLRLYWKP